MLICTCKHKIRDANNIINEYILQCMDDTERIIKLSARELKYEMAIGNIIVSNLKLTSNNRIIDAKPKNDNDENETKKFYSLASKAKIMGLEVKYLTGINEANKTVDECILVSKNKSEHVFYIPSNIVAVNGPTFIHGSRQLRDLTGTIKVIGGAGLRSIDNLFYECKAEIIDISKLDSSAGLIKSAYCTFYGCNAKEIIGIENLNMCNVISATSMFAHTRSIQKLDLNSWDTHNLMTAKSMFSLCNCKDLHIEKWDTCKLESIENMFMNSRIDRLDLSGWDTSKVERMACTFYGMHTKSLNLSNWNTENVLDMSYMFGNIEYKEDTLDLQSFKIKDEAKIHRMFERVSAIKIITSLPGALARYMDRGMLLSFYGVIDNRGTEDMIYAKR